MDFTAKGRDTLAADRRHREGWLAREIGELEPEEQVVIARATEILRRMAQSEG